MKRIKQLEDNDCGVACVAMILQRHANCPAKFSYAAAKAVMLGKKKAKTTHTKDLSSALSAYGIDLAGRRTKFAPVSKDDMGLDFDAIVATEPNKDSKIWHWMVWDSKRRILLDPLPKSKKKLKVRHCLEVKAAK